MGKILVRARMWHYTDYDDVVAGRRAPLERECLVDTGAVETVLPPALVQELGLTVRGSVPVRYASGKRAVRKLAQGLMVEIDGRETTTRAIVQPGLRRPMIGQTVLEALDLVADCKRGCLVWQPDHAAR